MIYLDYSASTPVDEELYSNFCNITRECPGNINSKNEIGKRSKRILSKAQYEVSKIFNCYGTDITFTSSASEANSMAIMGTASYLSFYGKHIITTKLEHDSILDCVKSLGINGYEIEYVNILPNGMVDLEDLENKIRKDTILVSICGVNSEIGFVQPLDKIKEVIDRKKYCCYFHSDLSQALGKIRIDLSLVDMASFSGHKIYSFLGCGMFYKRYNVPINKLIYGSDSNSVMRGGIPPIGLISSFAKMVEKLNNNIDDNYMRCMMLKERLLKGLEGLNIRINSNDMCIPHIVNISLLTIESEPFIKEMSDNEIYISKGDKCCHDEESILLDYLYHDKVISKTSVRISISHITTEEEIDKFVEIFKKIIENKNI